MSLGNWIKDNKQGVLGGLTTAAGIALAVGTAGAAMPIATGLIGSGVGMMGNEMQQDAAMQNQNILTNAQQKAQEDLLKQQATLQRKQLAAQQNLINAQGYTNTGTVFAYGGLMNNQAKGFTNFNGNRHEQAGIQLGNGAEVEGGETMFDNYVFSDRLKPDGSKKTFAELSDKIKNKYSFRKDDPYDKQAMKRQLATLAQEQELLKVNTVQQQFGKGGKMYLTGGEVTENLDNPPTTSFVYNGKNYSIPTNIYQQYFSSDYDNYLNAYNSNFNPRNSSANVAKGFNTGSPMSLEYYNLPKLSEESFNIVTGKAAPIVNCSGPECATSSTSIKKVPNTNTTSSSMQMRPMTTISDLKIKKEKVNNYTPYMNEKILQNFTLPTDQKTTTTTEGGSNWGNIGLAALSTVPNLLAAAGTNRLSNQVKYDRVNPELAQNYLINPALMDPRDAIRQVGINYANANQGLKQNSTGLGNYLTNRLMSAAYQSESTSNIYGSYNEKNSGILNATRQFNAQQAQQGSQFNAQLGFQTNAANSEIQMRELQDKLGLKQNALGLAAAGLNTGINTYMQEMRSDDMMKIAGGENHNWYQVENKWYPRFKGNGYDYYMDGNKQVPIK